MGEAVPRRNVSFEEGLKGDNLHSCKSESGRPISPSKCSDIETESGWLLTSSSRMSSIESSLAVTPRSPGSPLPLNFLFRHLSGIKSTLAEAMEVAQTPSCSPSETVSNSSSPSTRQHSYSRVKHRRPKGTALRAMNSCAIVSSLISQDKELLQDSEESKEVKLRRRKRFNDPGSQDLYGSSKIVAYKKSKSGSTNLKGRQGRHSKRRRKKVGAEQIKQALLYASRRLVLRKWDVQTALGPLLQLEGNDHSGLSHLTFPKVAESLSYCSDGTWRWQDCVVVGFDSNNGMYRTLDRTVSSDESSGEPWDSQNLSGYSSQQGGIPSSKSNSGSIGVSLDSTPSWRSKATSPSWSNVLSEDQQISMRLVARLNIRLQEEPKACRSFTDPDRDFKIISPRVQPTSIREPLNASANAFDDHLRDPPFKGLKFQQCRVRSEDISSNFSTEGRLRYGQICNFPSYCSTQGTVRQGHVASEISLCALKQALKPLYGVESRLGVAMNGGTSEKSMSNRRLSASGKSGPFMLPDFTAGGSVISDNLVNWRRKDRPDSAKCIVYDLFPFLSEIAQEFEHAASISACTDITSLTKAGAGYAVKGPRPVRTEGHSFLVHSMNLATSAAWLHPGLQSAMLLVVDSVKMLEKTRFLAVSVPCVSLSKALALQTDTIGESTTYIKNRVLADAKDALNTALVRDMGLRTENGSTLYIRIARWANILTETALAKALKGTLDMYAARFEEESNLLVKPKISPFLPRPLFLVKLCISEDNKLGFRTPLSKFNVFSGKLLDDLLEALMTLPFMDTKDLAHSKVQRDVLLNAADEALPICRHRVAEAVSCGTRAVDALQATLVALWTDFTTATHDFDLKARKVASSFQGYECPGRMDGSTKEDVRTPGVSEETQGSTDADVQSFSCFEDLVYSIKGLSEKLEKLLFGLTAAHGQVFGILFRFDCDEMILRTTCIGYDSKQKAANILLGGLRETIQQLNEQLVIDERVLAISLCSVSPESFAEVQAVIKSYQVDPHPLTRGIDLLHVCHSALEKLCLDISDDDVHAYWFLHARIQNLFVAVSSKDKFLMSARYLVMASIRAEQATKQRKATELVASILEIEALKDPKEAFEVEVLVQRKLEDLHSMSVEAESLARKEKLLEVYENWECRLNLAPAISKMEYLRSLWSTVANWNRDKELWMLESFQKLNVDQMFMMVQDFGDKLAELIQSSTASGASQVTLFIVVDEVWTGGLVSNLQDPLTGYLALAAGGHQQKAHAQKVNEILTKLPLLLRLRHPGVRRMHWIELASKTGCWEFHDGAEGLTLKAVLDLPVLVSHQEMIWTVLERAAEEYNQEVCLEKMEEEMRRVVIEVTPYNEDSGRQMLYGSEVVLDLLEDQLVAAGCMLHSPFAKALEGPIRAWKDKLNILLQLLQGLLSFQKWFKILLPIFQSVNIRQQLADESRKFEKIDFLWKQVLDTIVQRRCFMHLCESSIIFDSIPQSIKRMEGIMCSLINLLERKRITFPRFFFLSNDELLQILSQEQNPNEIQYYLCKCFCDLSSIEFTKDAQVSGMWINRAEYLPFLEHVRTSSGPVEEWMAAVEKEMKRTVLYAILGRLQELQISITYALAEQKDHKPVSVNNSQKSKMLSKPPALQRITRFGKPVDSGTKMLSESGFAAYSSICQIVIVAANVAFSTQVERLLVAKVNVMKELQLLSENLAQEVQEYIGEIKSCSSGDRKEMYKSLVVLFIYLREVVNGIMTGSWVGVDSFEWQRSLRYYWHPDGDCRVCIMSMDRLYGCELINHQNRLVMTSLTEKCFLGLLYAFSLGLGGMVTGAAGVGKTESVKDCAKAVGKHCIVMNCSEEFDHISIGNVLKGMVSGGLWLCLNEFECLRAEIMSTLIQHLLSIKHAIATKAQRYNFEGLGLQLNPSFAICATTTSKLTAAGSDYTRNTRSSFRSVTMIMPDCKLIMQVLLTAEGFSDPLNVARKLTLCFKMAGEQLSFKDNHCNFGLRAMRAVIRWMSVLKSAPEMKFLEWSVDKHHEELILCKTLQQYCLPRLEADGFLLFSNVLNDFFPDLMVPPLSQRELELAIKSSLTQSLLNCQESLIQKCLQLHGAMKVHRGVLIVGGSGAGKTQCYRTLSDAVNLMGFRTPGKVSTTLESNLDPTSSPVVTLRVVNPSASTTHLFGSTNPKTQTWQDGIMPNILHECEARVKKYGGKTWMVLDGDMDSTWLELISTMLDDTGLLCLNNGNRILMPSIDSFSMLFEVENLRSMSPGTVSRCGIILMDSQGQSWNHIVSSWLQRCPISEFQAILQGLFESFLTPCLEVVMRCPQLPVGQVGLINNLLYFLEACLKLAGMWSDHPSQRMKEERQPILQISGFQISRNQMKKSDIESEEVSAKSSIKKLGRVKHFINQSQKEVRDAVNWRRLHQQRLLTCASSQVNMEEEQIDDTVERRGNLEYEHEKVKFSAAGHSHLSQNPWQLPSSGKSVLSSLFLFGLVWAIGGHLSHTGMKEQFETVLREVAVLSDVSNSGPLPEGSIFNYYYDLEAQTWKSWDELLTKMQSFSTTASTALSPWTQSLGTGSHLSLSLEQRAFFVPTTETMRVEFLAHSLSRVNRPVLLAGAPGTGKTILAAQLLHQHNRVSKCQVVGVTLNSTSCASTLHDILRPKLTIWKRRILVPSGNGKMVVFVDDLQNAQLHARKDAQAIQFLRFLVEHKGWYGLPMDSSFTTVDGIIHLAAMTTKLGPTMNSSSLARLYRHYFIIQSTDYSPFSLQSIFFEGLRTCSHELNTDVDMTSILTVVSQACVEMYTRLKAKLPSSTSGDDDLRALLSLHDLFHVRRRLLLATLNHTAAASLQKCFNFWSYEFCRVSCDRLKSQSERERVICALLATTEQVFKLKSNDQRQYLESLIDEEQQPIYGSYYFHDARGGGIGQSLSCYQEVICRKDWEQSMEQFLASYTAEGPSQSPIVLFPAAVSHLSRLLNILCIVEGHALLLGYSGSGRRSLARLASYIIGYTLLEIQVNGNYTSQQWTAYLGNLLKTCSLLAKPTMFLIIIEADCNIQNQIMEDLNLIVHCGQATDILGEDEKYYIQQELHRIEEANALYPELSLGSDREQYLNNCFVNRLKENLHLVICAENATYKDTMCTGSIASTIISQHFVVDYYDNWTPAALQAVAKVTLVECELVKNLCAVDMELVTKSCSIIHTISNRLTASIPSKGSWRLVGMPSYHEMLHVFGRMSEQKGMEVDRNLQRLETGLHKLQSTRILVENMQHELQELLRCKDSTDSHMDHLLLSISNEEAQMDKALEEVAHDEKVAAEEAEACKKLAQEAQDQVQEVAPEVLLAIKQLSQLNKKDISELKSFTQPPPRLLTVLEALCIILKKEPMKRAKHTSSSSGNHANAESANSYWPIARELLSQVDFVRMLLSFNKDAMENCTMEKLKPYMENALFKPEKVRRISVACRSICVWIRAMYNYHYAKTMKMEPRIERLKIANHNLDVCKEKLEDARRRLAIAEQNLINLRRRYDDASSTKDGLAKRADDSEVKLQRAIRLIGRLDGECSRWSLQVNDLKGRRKNVVGDTILASGIVAYLGSFSASIRCKFISEWQQRFQEMGLSYSPNFSLVTFYTTPQDIKEWVSAGLPPDDHSLENAIIVTNSSRSLLILDPQKQVSKWICNIEDQQSISVVDINSSTVLEEAHSCSMTGQTIVIENIGNETPSGLLKQLISVRRSGKLIKSVRTDCAQQGISAQERGLHCGCVLLAYDQGFNYSDEVNVSISLNIVNFSITFRGLCSQLLSIAAEKERVDLEEERAHLMQQRLLLICRLQEIEDNILTLLQGVMVTILDDEALEDALSKATATYADIQTKLARAAATEEAVEISRKRHLPVAERAAILYSCIADVSRLESVYQWTLPWFKTVYSTSMQRTSALNPVDFLTRLDYLISKITIAIVTKICCGLLYKHRILFGLLVVFRLAQARYDVGREEWMFLLQGKPENSFECSSDESCPTWLDPMSNQWKQLRALSKFPRFEGLVEDMHKESWREFYVSSQSYQLPGSWNERLGPFRSLLVLRCLRLDLIMKAVEELIRDQLNLGKEDLTEISVQNAYEDSTPDTPITCIFRGVVTPLDQIMTCAKRSNMLKRLWVFSLEQCQGPKMLEAVKEAATWGKWVLLQNCHTNVPWINSCLRVALNDVKTRQIHKSFRLWLTTEPMPGRPPYLLAESVKVVVEHAKGVKSKMTQILQIEKADEIYVGNSQTQMDKNHVNHPQGLFQLVLFHSIVQERAHFGAMGWNLPVELDHTVFHLAKTELCKLNHDISVADSNSSSPPLEVLDQNKNTLNCLQYMITKVVYGGYIVDDRDEYLMLELFRHCFCSNENGSCESFASNARGTLDDFLLHARSLPDSQDPEVLGLPKDAVTDRAREDVDDLFREALTLETSKESIMAPPTSVFETKKSLILECFSEIRGIVKTTLNEQILRSQTQKTPHPFSLLLLQEVQRYNRLTSTITASIAKAVKAIEIPGYVTPDLEALFTSIIAGQVPRLWLSEGYASLKSLTSWMSDFRRRIEFMRSWVEDGRPDVIWVSVLFFPQAIFAATLQCSARTWKLPLSSLYLDVIMMGEAYVKVEEEPADDGCHVSGLYLEGARWDPENHALAESEPNHLTSKMCDLWLRPRPEATPVGKGRVYCCPVYTTQARNGLQPCAGCNFVGTIDLPTGSMSPMHWGLRGVALICSCRD